MPDKNQKMEREVEEGVGNEKYQVVPAFLKVEDFNSDGLIKWDAESSVDGGAHALTDFFVQFVVFWVHRKVLFG